MNTITITSILPYYIEVLEYIYILGKDRINDFCYLNEFDHKRYYRFGDLIETKSKILVPGRLNIDVKFNEETIHCEHDYILDSNKDRIKVRKSAGSNVTFDSIYMELKISHPDKNILIEFIDKAKQIKKERDEKNKKKIKGTIKIYYYKSDWWNLFSITNKRPLNTLYLKENERDNLIDSIETFFSPEEKRDYLEFGVPYKRVIFLYGVPGSGKTTTINCIASHFDCDIHIIPLSTDMTDQKLVDAFSSVNDEETKANFKKIIVIEDIDCVFSDRKEGDCMKNGVTLQGLLNCLDGFTSLEGGLIFITANRPEVLDEAMIRSCRVDYKLELDYADTYQTETMYKRLLPEQIENFDKFYKSIRHKKYTTAMLQEFLFYNRKCKNILEHIDDFQTIIDRNDPKNLEKDSKDKKNHYM